MNITDSERLQRNTDMTLIGTVANQGTGRRINQVFSAITMQQAGDKRGSEENVLETQASPHDQRENRSPRFSLPIGSRPLDGYTIKRGIGSGGFGEVYYAKSDGGKDVALKSVQRNLDIELRGVRQCLNIKHPNLLALFDIKHDDHDQVWVIMEYVAGESLQAVIERNPNGLPLDAIVGWFDGMAAGTAHLHECGIVHRDLKPANLFVEEDTIKIGDYGLSKFISCSRRSAQTQSVGTFHYMAPEIGQGRYGREIDIYALGIILYEMLTGFVPFDGESSQEIIMKHLTAQPPLEPVPVPFRGLLVKALAKDPQDRFHTMDELRQAFHEAVAVSRGANPAAAAVAANAASPTGSISSVSATVAAAALATGAAVRSRAAIPNEPIAQAAIAASRELAKGWRESNLGVLPKLVIAVVGIILIANNASWIIPYAGGLALAYGIYLGARTMLVKAPTTEGHFAGTRMRQRHETRAVKHRRRVRPVVKLQPVHMRKRIAERPMPERATELLGSLLQSAAVACVFSLAVALSIEHSSGLYTWVTNFVWLALSSTVASWLVLTFGKAWETTSGDHFARRIWMAAGGVVAGIFSFVLAKLLLFQPTYVLPDLQMLRLDELSPRLYEPDGMPRLAAFIIFFGILFAGVRWWRQADPTRRFRLSLFSTVFSVVIAVVLQSALPLPQAFLLAGITTVAVQMSAPWFSRNERDQLRKTLNEAAEEIA